MSHIEIMPIIPFDDGQAAGKATGAAAVRAETVALLKDPLLRETFGQMSRTGLTAAVMAQLHTTPDFTRYPELVDLYAESLEVLRGFARGAECTLEEAAVCDFLRYKHTLETWHDGLQPHPEQHCSGVLLVGPDGILGGKSHETVVEPKPEDYRWRKPRPYAGLRQMKTQTPHLVLRKPRTGYIEEWGTTNECGVGCLASVSCSTWLDDPIEDTWPIKGFPVLRFAQTAAQAAELITRYTLYCWGRASQVWADTSGDGFVLEKSFRRAGIRRVGPDGVLWCTEGHFEHPEMFAFIRERRVRYLERMGRHAGAGDMQYAADCNVRFTHMGELCHEAWGKDYEHMRRILTDHATFPRAVCRHGGPDTDPYDVTVTNSSHFIDITHNRVYARTWIPWKKFPCQMPEAVTQFPLRPADGDTL
ncbi:MAG: hypothetical protein ACYC6A_01240 [Armatimonadota bacterium]